MDSKQIKELENSEYIKYTRLHAQRYGSTGYQKQVSEFIRWTTNPTDRVLDLGCGTGVAVDYLKQARYTAMGVDITLVGVKKISRAHVRAPLWSLPFADEMFDCSFSVDVMEHLPTALVERTMDEIFRVTRAYTIHVVCDRVSHHEKDLHLTVKPIGWWEALFAKHNKRGIKCMVMTAEQFLISHGRIKDGLGVTA